MEARLRGIIEQFIDDRLSASEVTRMRQIANEFESLGIPFDMETAVGYLLGYTWGRLSMTCLMYYGRSPTLEETDDYYQIIIDRMPSIRSRFHREWNI